MRPILANSKEVGHAPGQGASGCVRNRASLVSKAEICLPSCGALQPRTGQQTCKAQWEVCGLFCGLTCTIWFMPCHCALQPWFSPKMLLISFEMQGLVFSTRALPPQKHFTVPGTRMAPFLNYCGEWCFNIHCLRLPILLMTHYRSPVRSST
jgi:hypothetical protein